MDKHDQQMKKLATDAFAGHIVRRQDDRSILLQRTHDSGWDDPDRRWDSTYLAEIIAAEAGRLIVHGDIPLVAFGYSGGDMESRLRWIGGTTDVDYYIHQKASMGTRVPWKKYDQHGAKCALEELVDERLQELRDCYDGSGPPHDDVYCALDQFAADVPNADLEEVTDLFDDLVQAVQRQTDGWATHHRAWLQELRGADDNEARTALARDYARQREMQLAEDDDIFCALKRQRPPYDEQGWRAFIDHTTALQGWEPAMFCTTPFVCDPAVYYAWAACRRALEILHGDVPDWRRS